MPPDNIAELGKNTRFPVNRPDKPHTQKHPNGYLTPILKKLLSKKLHTDIKQKKKVLNFLKVLVLLGLLNYFMFCIKKVLQN